MTGSGRVAKDQRSPVKAGWSWRMERAVLVMSASVLRATLIGLTAILMWALLGALASANSSVPPFLMNGLSFGLSGLGSLAWLLLSGKGISAFRQPVAVWLLGTGGLFGFHALYFTALKLAPPVEANLINYLWPLLIVLFSGLLPGETLKAHHIIGVLIGFAGAGLLIAGGGFSLDSSYLAGYLAAFSSAVTWAGYSVLSRRFANVPTEAVSGFCLSTAALSFLVHGFVEETVLPAGLFQWSMLVLLAALPVGLAFFVWDYGVKRGDIKILGASAYAAPVLSTLVLVAAGFGSLTVTTGLACLLVTGGALIAAKDLFMRS